MTSSNTTESLHSPKPVNGDNALNEAKLMMATGRTNDQALQLLYNAVNSGTISQEGLQEAVRLIRRYG